MHDRVEVTPLLNREGRWEAWHPNGTTQSVAHFSDSVLSGRHAEWSDRGDRRARGRYRHGEPVGRWSRWGDDGSREIERISPQAANAQQ